MLLAVTLALALSAADQFRAVPMPPGNAAPIPTGEAAPDGCYISVGLSTAVLVRLGCGYTEGRREWDWEPGGLSGEWAVKVVGADEHAQTTVRTRVSPGNGPAVVTRLARYVGNQAAVWREAYSARWGRGVRTSYRYYPVEGVCVYVGFDASLLDAFAGVRIAF